MSGSADLRRLTKYPLVLGTLAISGVSAFTLFYFPPSLYHFYPVCPIWSLFHVQCPGCGTTRALAALLHGHVEQAMRFNHLTICALPLIAIRAGYRSARVRLGHVVGSQALSRSWLYAGSAAIVAFTLLRNL